MVKSPYSTSTSSSSSSSFSSSSSSSLKSIVGAGRYRFAWCQTLFLLTFIKHLSNLLRASSCLSTTFFLSISLSVFLSISWSIFSWQLSIFVLTLVVAEIHVDVGCLSNCIESTFSAPTHSYIFLISSIGSTLGSKFIRRARGAGRRCILNIIIGKCSVRRIINRNTGLLFVHVALHLLLRSKCLGIVHRGRFSWALTFLFGTSKCLVLNIVVFKYFINYPYFLINWWIVLFKINW